jgi:hypothetical protein
MKKIQDSKHYAAIVLAATGLIPLSVRHEYRRPPGECSYCDSHRTDSMMPPHTASSQCESGKREHCTCDVCF